MQWSTFIVKVKDSVVTAKDVRQHLASVTTSRITVKKKPQHTNWNDSTDIRLATHYCNKYMWLIWYEDGMSDPRYWSGSEWCKATDLSLSECERLY